MRSLFILTVVFASVGCTVWEGPPIVATPAGHADDASRLNQTAVAEIWPVPANRALAEKQLQQLMARARLEKKSVSIAGARHSMGGHTIASGGIVIDTLSMCRMSLDESTGILRVGAGARWSALLEYLHPKGRSVAVMQSNHDFTVGGSISVNCHGWQHDQPPVVSTVRSFRLMKADGSIVECSRQKNRELFGLVLGGYGLFGLILDVELQTVPNVAYSMERYIVPGRDYRATFDKRVGPQARMAFGRLSVVPGQWFDEAILYVMTPARTEKRPSAVLKTPPHTWLRRSIFRGSVNSAMGKSIRWSLEKSVGETTGAKLFWRNQLLYKPVADYANQSNWTTDVLHEYFVPHEQFDAFLDRARVIMADQKPDLLNVTVRTVEADEDTVLRYADRKMFALVMLFNQSRTDASEEKMIQLTRRLIDAAIAVGGRYYLPYRLHATKEQFHRAYPMSDKFFELKRRHDPGGLFSNKFYKKYGQKTLDN
jgi:FAD/FMN-containing dehydrogenase